MKGRPNSRRVVGYAFADSLHTDVVETALRRAVTFRDADTSGVIFHADRGCQYTSTQLADAAQELGVLLSVGRTGVCWDNAQIESFWSTLKTEFYNRYCFTTRAEAIHAVSSWIETVYNRRRRHSALDAARRNSSGLLIEFPHPGGGVSVAVGGCRWWLRGELRRGRGARAGGRSRPRG